MYGIWIEFTFPLVWSYVRFCLVIILFYEQPVIKCGYENNNFSIIEMLPFFILDFLEQLIKLYGNQKYNITENSLTKKV